MRITPGIRFEYIWQHFCMAFLVPSEVKVNYSTDPGLPGVTIRNTDTQFFSGERPHPTEWVLDQVLGTSIPFLFHSEKETTLNLSERRAFIEYDIIAGAFFFLSGWQERYSADKDKFGRFPFKASLQSKLKFITRPVVNYYFELLREAIEHVYQIRLLPRLASQGALAFNLTHDIDRLTSGWKIAGIHELRQGQVSKVVQLLWSKVSGKDAWDNVEEMALEEKLNSTPATYFFMTEPDKWNGHPNADYRITNPRIRKKLDFLENQGAEIGLHGSFGTSTDPGQFLKETGLLDKAVKGNRFHYLLFDPAKTPALLDQAGVMYDATLGFAEHFGFRHGYCLPFHLFDFENNRAHTCLEIPLHLMDVTLHHPNYLQHTPETTLTVLKPLLEEVTKFNGVLSVLWHNEHYSDFKYAGWRKVVEWLIGEARLKGSAFMNCRQLAESFSIPVTSG